MDYDVFNGDADGICALQQLRLAEPRDATLVTGIKRDIALLQQVPLATAKRVTVLDVSLDKNQAALVNLLENNTSVFYADHHFPGDIPDHPSLTAHIDTDANTCTSLIVNTVLGGSARRWAVVGAFGDNLDEAAHQAAASLNLDEDALMSLRRLGQLLNYNGYGASLDDLHSHPADLYREIKPFENPLDFINNASVFAELDEGYTSDMANARAIEPLHASPSTALYMLPNEAFARRASGTLANELARTYPDRAHAMLTERGDETYLVSVRAPLNNKTGADELCRSFPTGGGRQAAAGINQLPATDLERFVEALQSRYN